MYYMINNEKKYTVLSVNFNNEKDEEFLAAWDRAVKANGGDCCNQSALAKKLLKQAVMGVKKKGNK